MRKAILVEGVTDVLAVEAMARRLGRDLEREGVAVVSLGGGGGLQAELVRLGPTGLGVELLGLCDIDHETRWARRLERAGLGRDLDREAMEALGFFVCDIDHETRWARRLERAGLGRDLDRVAMEDLGFFVCDRDLEDELIRALGVEAVERVIADQGDLHSLETLRKQPYHRDGNRHDQLRRFFTSQSGRKRYIPLLVQALEPGKEPRPLREVLARA